MMIYVVATDQSCSVKDFVVEVYAEIGFSELTWQGVDVEMKLYGKGPE